MEDDTYSLIFSALRHPLRRGILRLLVEEERTFSEMLKELSIDSGHLNYHLECLGNLVSHTSEGMYRLSRAGEAALNLMVGVEEPRRTVGREVIGRKIGLNIVIVIVVVTFLASYLASYHFFFAGEMSPIPTATPSPVSSPTLIPTPTPTQKLHMTFRFYTGDFLEYYVVGTALNGPFNYTMGFEITFADSNSMDALIKLPEDVYSEYRKPESKIYPFLHMPEYELGLYLDHGRMPFSPVWVPGMDSSGYVEDENASTTLGPRTVAHYYNVEDSEEGRYMTRVYVDRETNIPILVVGSGPWFQVRMELSNASIKRLPTSDF